MTIYDVAKLSAEEAWQRVRLTIARYPTLQRIYDEAKLADLIRRRQAVTNHLLFWLALPAEDERSVGFWSSVIADLEVLEAQGSFKKFRGQMQHEEKERLTSWRTELWIAAWLKRNGIGLTFEPAVVGKRPELVTDTTPKTWWEVKTPLELQEQRAEDAAIREAQRRLREIPEPFVLHIVRAKLAAADVPRAINEIRALIRVFAEANGDPPALFESGGLAIEVGARTKHRPTGFLGTTNYDCVFGDEHAEQIADKIGSAIPQLPTDGAGVVVIDRTLSDWSDEENAIDACFGVLGVALRDGDLVDTRGHGYFQPDRGTRISAVVSYSRHPMHWEYGPELLFIHNPFANIPLAEELFRFPGVRHMRRVDVPGGYHLEITGDGVTATE